MYCNSPRPIAMPGRYAKKYGCCTEGMKSWMTAYGLDIGGITAEIDLRAV